MYTAEKSDIYKTENLGIGKVNALTSLLDNQGTLIPRLGYYCWAGIVRLCQTVEYKVSLRATARTCLLIKI